MSSRWPKVKREKLFKKEKSSGGGGRDRGWGKVLRLRQDFVNEQVRVVESDGAVPNTGDFTVTSDGANVGREIFLRNF